jgi:hypothetical protein
MTRGWANYVASWQPAREAADMMSTSSPPPPHHRLSQNHPWRITAKCSGNSTPATTQTTSIVMHSFATILNNFSGADGGVSSEDFLHKYL